MNPYIFVYGTLRKGNKHPVAARFHQHAEFLGEAVMHGKLTQIGPYPAAIYQPDGDNVIEGQVFKMKDPVTLISMLDDYEGIGEQHPYPHEYLRKECPVKLAGRSVNCWVYLYNDT